MLLRKGRKIWLFNEIAGFIQFEDTKIWLEEFSKIVGKDDIIIFSGNCGGLEREFAKANDYKIVEIPYDLNNSLKPFLDRNIMINLNDSRGAGSNILNMFAAGILGVDSTENLMRKMVTIIRSRVQEVFPLGNLTIYMKTPHAEKDIGRVKGPAAAL